MSHDPAPMKPPLTLARVMMALFALLCGAMLYVALEMAFAELAGTETPVMAGHEKPQAALACIAVAAAITGYVTAWIARGLEVVAALAVAAVIAYGPAPATLDWHGVPRPSGLTKSFLVVVPMAAAGALARRRMARSQAARRAPLALPLAIRQRPAMVGLGFVLAVGMTAAAIWAVGQQDATRSAWAAIPLFAAAALFLGWRLFSPAPQAVLRSEGVEIRALRVTIPWSEIEDAYVSRHHPIDYLHFRVRDPHRYLGRMNSLQTFLSQTGEPEPNIGLVLSTTGYTAEEIAAFVRPLLGGRGETPPS